MSTDLQAAEVEMDVDVAEQPKKKQPQRASVETKARKPEPKKGAQSQKGGSQKGAQSPKNAQSQKISQSKKDAEPQPAKTEVEPQPAKTEVEPQSQKNAEPGNILMEKSPEFAQPDKKEDEPNSLHFTVLAVLFEVAMLVLYCVFSDYNMGASELGTDVDYVVVYPFYQDVHVMIFIGFGFLMTFLKNYGGSAVSLNLFLASVAIQLVMLLNSFWSQVAAIGKDSNIPWEKVHLGVNELVEGDFGAAAVLITFGALLGKTSSFQLFIVTICEIFFYSINKMIIEKQLQAFDAGGSIIIHLFGAYFGLSASLMLKNPKFSDHPNNATTPISDLFALIGTVFLWMFWPSFNAGLCGLGEVQHRAIVNSVLVLTGSSISAFLVSSLLRPNHKFSMVDVQNATLAGGVAMGSSVSLAIYPGPSMGLGIGAGALSVMGYIYLTPILEKKIGLHDTCGVNNLHGMPGILGALVSVIVAGASGPAHGYTAGGQAGIQVAALGVSLGIAAVGGLITGLIAKCFSDTYKGDYFSDESNFATE